MKLNVPYMDGMGCIICFLDPWIFMGFYDLNFGHPTLVTGGNMWPEEKSVVCLV